MSTATKTKVWCFWQCKNENFTSKSEWRDSLRLNATVATYDECREAIQATMNINQATNGGSGLDYMFFREGVPPMWENEANVKGGRWVFNYPKSEAVMHTNRIAPLHQYWRVCVDALFRQLFDAHNEMNDKDDLSAYINGAWLSEKVRGKKLSVWTREASLVDVQQRIGRRLKELLGLRVVALVYEPHECSPEVRDAIKAAQLQKTAPTTTRKQLPSLAPPTLKKS